MPWKKQQSGGEQSREIRALGLQIERANRSLKRADDQIKQHYVAMKTRYPKFWEMFGFKSEQEYLSQYDLGTLESAMTPI